METATTLTPCRTQQQVLARRTELEAVLVDMGYELDVSQVYTKAFRSDHGFGRVVVDILDLGYAGGLWVYVDASCVLRAVPNVPSVKANWRSSRVTPEGLRAVLASIHGIYSLSTAPSV